MKALSSLVFVTAAALSSIVPIRGAVNPAIVPADARWVIYADLNALRASTVGKEIVALAEKQQLENSKIGIDPQKLFETVGTVTAYGTNFSQDPKAIDGTLVLQGTADLRKIVESILLQATIASPETVAESKDLPFPSYTVTPKHQGDTAPLALIVAFPPEPIVLVSKSRAQVLKARDAFRGNAASVASTADAVLKPLLRMSRDAYLFAATIIPADTVFPENQPQARILKMTNSGSIALGERGPNTFAHASLVATSDDMAEKLDKILQGLTAMMSFTETNDKQLAEFLNSAKVAREDRAVTLDLSYASERLVQMIRSMHQHQAPRARESEPHGPQPVGDTVAQWQAEAAEGEAGQGSPSQLAWRTVDNVVLKNSAQITLTRDSNGGKPVRFDRVEITSAVAGSSPLIFRSEVMRQGPRGNSRVFAFPGVDGTYTLKIAYINDPEGKATYLVSVRQPKGNAPAGASDAAKPAPPARPASDKS